MVCFDTTIEILCTTNSHVCQTIILLLLMATKLALFDLVLQIARGLQSSHNFLTANFDALE